MADDILTPADAPASAPGADSTESVAGTPAETPQPAPSAPSADLNALQSRLAQAEQAALAARQDADAIKRYVVQLATLQAQPQVNPQERDAQFREALDRDPRAAMAAAAEERLRPMLEEMQATQLQQSAERERMMALERIQRSDDPHDRAEWSKYAPEVEQFMAAMPLDVQAKPGVWDAAFDQIRTKHLKDILRERTTRVVTQERTGALEGGSGLRTAPAPNAELSQEERRMAKAFGMTDAEWKTHRAAIHSGEAA